MRPGMMNIVSGNTGMHVRFCGLLAGLQTCICTHAAVTQVNGPETAVGIPRITFRELPSGKQRVYGVRDV